MTTPLYTLTIKKVLLTAMFTSIAVRDPRDPSGQTYLRLEDNQAALCHPSSSISRDRKYDFVFYDKFVDKGKPYFTTVTGFPSNWLFEAPMISVHINKLLDEPPEGSANWTSLQKLRLARDKYKRSLSGTAEPDSDAKASQSQG